MTKTTKPSKIRADPATNPRSRAARQRASSPSMNVDKSIKNAPRASDATPVLAATRGGGVMKKQKKKQMTRGQRVRQEKGLVRAEAVMDQMIKKVDASKARARRTDQRRGQWENINDAAEEEVRKAVKAPLRNTKEEDWEDVKDGDDDDVDMKATETKAKPVENMQPTSAPDSEAHPAPLVDDLDLIE